MKEFVVEGFGKLTSAELSKYGDKRISIFLNKVASDSSFEVFPSPGTVKVLPTGSGFEALLNYGTTKTLPSNLNFDV